MRESFEVTSSTGRYCVTSGIGLLADVIAENPGMVVVIDARLEKYLPAGVSRKMSIDAIEANKSLEHMPETIIGLRQQGVDRTSHLLAIGGGVIQDIVTFCASIYMRGIPWTYMPTTLLGMADSCIGGKSSVNVQGFKNLVGNFHPPSAVLIDMEFVGSLDPEQVVGGLFEAVKICYARGNEEFQEFLLDASGGALAAPDLQRVVMRALRAKKWFIEIDEFDQKERLLLNFGHTFGHALEAGTSFGISHGIAVGIGMLVAQKYAGRKKWLSAIGEERSAQLRMYIHGLLARCGPEFFSSRSPVDLNLVLAKFDNDKKHRRDFYRVVAPRGDGALELLSEPRNEAVRLEIAAEYESVLGDIGWRYHRAAPRKNAA